MSERVDWFLGSHGPQEEKLKEMGQECGEEKAVSRENTFHLKARSVGSYSRVVFSGINPTF